MEFRKAKNNSCTEQSPEQAGRVDAGDSTPQQLSPREMYAIDEIVSTLLKIDYETIAVIDAETGKPLKYLGQHFNDVITEQERAGDYSIGIEAYLKKYCVDDDVDLIIRETSLPNIKAQLETRASFPVGYSLRKNGKLVHNKIVFTYLNPEKTTILCAVQNLTEIYLQESGKRDQIASALQTLQEQGGMDVARYDLKTKTLYSNSSITSRQGFGEIIQNVPEAFFEKGLVAPESIDEYRQFYSRLCAGKASAVTFAMKTENGFFHWYRADSRLIYDKYNTPFLAILSFKDIDAEREHAAVYQKWRQSLEHRKPENYTLFRCNLTKGSSFDKREGSLLKIAFDPTVNSFNERTREYAGRFVHLDDFDAYTALLNSENLLAGYYRGTRTLSMDYREKISEEEYRWLRLTVEMAPYPDSLEIEVFLMYERPDSIEAENPSLRQQSETDSLTGVLNRRAFIERFTHLLTAEQPHARHALILADIDDFKRINTQFGHAIGDQALVDMADSLNSLLQDDGILGRLGGDVFLICLKDVSGAASAEQKATRILATLRKEFSMEIRVTASLGVALYPDDGEDFNTLYRSADMALYTAKTHGNDSFALFSGDQKRKGLSSPATFPAHNLNPARHKGHLLLIDDDSTTQVFFQNTFGKDFDLHICTEESSAVSHLHRYGIAMSAVLLSLSLSSANGFSLLKRIRTINSVNSVPVIVLCKMDERDQALQALQQGASEFLLKPVDPKLAELRINSVISKAENQRLRVQNTYLQTQYNDASQFRSVYENTGTVVVEYDWENHTFVYDPAISSYILGNFNDRSLWQILMSDMVADVKDVKAMQDLLMKLANSRTQTNGTLDIMLRTPSKARHWFTMKAFRRVNDRNLTSKLILTFRDVNDDILAGKKLRFQAEHDSLTGLYNRPAFLALITETVSKRPGGSYVLLCCDINDFRFVNERYGREEGDKLLQYCAEKLLVNVSSVNGFAGRLSNDVFIALVPNSPDIMARSLSLTTGFFDGYPLKTKLTGRVGAYIISDPDMPADAMLDMASTASNSIKGKFASWLAVYDDSMNEIRLREKSISDRMEAALADGQFDVYLQPQFHHATGQIVGAEALVRWIDPKRGVIPPSEFIPLFEKNGFITKMDEYIWEKTAQYLASWMERGNEPVPVSVNVSREDTNDPELCKKLLAIVEKYNLPIHLFRLEITESLFSEDTRRLASVVEQLHNAGFLIEMDDFGSGYSSLNILKDIPVDVLKLDMRFLSGTDNLGRGGMIINAVLRMSRWLEIPVIAEGVELKDQADFLLSVGCPTIQGFLYEKPMPATDFEQMLLQSNRGQLIPEDTIHSILETHSFWNPHSADSQIFNNYIGPAAVFEYHNGDYEIVRMNARFFDAMKIKGTVKLPAQGMVHLSEADKPRFKKAVLEVIYSGKEVKIDVRFDLSTGSVQLFRITLRLIAKSIDRALLFAVVES